MLTGLGFKVFAACLTSEGADKLQGACSDRVTTLLLDVTDEKSIAAARHFVESRLPADTGQTHQSGSQCFILRLFIIPIWIAGRHRSDPPVSQSVFYSASVHYTNLDCRQTQAIPTSQSVSQSVFYTASVHYTKLDCRQTQVRPTSQSISVLYCVCSLYQVGLPAGTGQNHQSVSVLYCVCSLYQVGLPAGAGQTHQSVSQCFLLCLFILLLDHGV